MGDMNHNVVIATTWKDEEMDRLSAWINSLGGTLGRELFVFAQRTMNGTRSIIMVPDGSKEGWLESDDGDSLRESFILELEKRNFSDGSSPWSWVEVGFGDYGQKVLQGNNTNKLNDAEYAI